MGPEAIINIQDITMKTSPTPLPQFTGDLGQMIMAGVAAAGSDGKGKDGLQGFLAKVVRDNPKLAAQMRSYARHFAAAGHGPPTIGDEEAG
jgi:hypothetical protein